MGAIGLIRCKPPAMIGGRSQDIGRIRSSRGERHQATHTVTRSANTTWLHIVLRREVIEKCTSVRHDVGGRGEGEELLHQDLPLLRIREDGIWVHRLVWPGPIKEIRKQYIINMGADPPPVLEHWGTNPKSNHEYENSWPRPVAVRAIDIARAAPIVRLNFDLVHEYLFSTDGRGIPLRWPLPQTRLLACRPKLANGCGRQAD